MRRFLAVLIATVALVAGCARPADRATPELGAAIEHARTAMADLVDRSIRLEKNLATARGVSSEIREALWKAASEGRVATPPDVPASLLGLCDDIEDQVERIDAFVLPRIDESLKEVGCIRAGVGVLSGPVLDELLAAEIQNDALLVRAEKAEARADRLEQEKNDVIYKLLIWAILVGVMGTAGGVAIAMFSPWTKLGAGIAMGSFILFGTASAFWRWLNEIQWVMLVFMGIGLLVVVILLILIARRNWKSVVQLIQGGQDWKEVLKGLAKKSSEELLELFKDTGVLRKLFNETQKAAQDTATQAMVIDVKKANGSNDEVE